MLNLEDMTPEQRAVLRACEDRYDEVTQIEDPYPKPPPVFVTVKREKEKHPTQYIILPDGSIRTWWGGCPVPLYGTPSKKTVDPDWGSGLPKHATKYLDEEQERQF